MTSEKDILDVVDELHAALLNEDAERLGGLLSDDLTFAHSIGVVEDKPTTIARFTTTGFHFGTREATVRIRGSIAVVDALVELVADGRVIMVLYVFEEQGSTWRLIARHAIKTVPAAA